jgi:hypothetical protein
MVASRDNATGGTLPDDELMRMIVEAYQGEDLRVPLPAVIRRRARRRAPRPALFAALAAAAAAVVVIMVVSMSVGPQPGPVGPGGTPTTTSDKVLPTTTASVDSQRCADIYAQTYPNLPLPPLRFELAAPDPRLRLLLFGDEQHLVGCWLNYDRVDIGGNPVAVNPTDGSYVLSAYGVQVLDPAYVAEQAEYGFGATPPGTTAVEIRFATTEPVQAALIEGWWARLGVGEYRLDEATELVFRTPEGETTSAIRHG